MEFIYDSINDPNVPEFKSFNVTVSPINSKISRNRFHPTLAKSPIFDPYASSDSSASSSDLASPFVRYLRSSSPKYQPQFNTSGGSRSKSSTSGGSRSSSGGGGGGGSFRSPLASIENFSNPPVFRTPVKVEEDVVVMDGILVEPKNGAKTRSSPQSASGESRTENSFLKSGPCRLWEESGNCRFGSKCRFLHGTEDLRATTAFANRSKSEASICRSYSSGSCSYGPRCRFVHHQIQSIASHAEAAPMATPTTTILESITSVKAKETSVSNTTSTIASSGTDWSPMDDNIEVTLPSSGGKSASREDVDAYIQTVLYGPSGRKRLSVFTDLCEDVEE